MSDVKRSVQVGDTVFGQSGAHVVSSISDGRCYGKGHVSRCLSNTEGGAPVYSSYENSIMLGLVEEYDELVEYPGWFRLRGTK